MALFFFLYDMHIVSKASWISRCDYHWTKPFVNRSNRFEFGLAPTVISITMPDTNEFSFPHARAINIYTRVFENWISLDWLSVARHWMYYIMRIYSIKSSGYIEVCNDYDNGARVATICNFTCWLAILYHYTRLCLSRSKSRNFN